MTARAAANAELSYWIDLAKRYPVMSLAEETAAAQAFRHGDAAAGERLLLAHLRLVVKLARKYGGYGLPANDLVNEGNVGLTVALRKFDPEKGFRFATYAMWWVKAEMQAYIIRSRSLVKYGTTAQQKKLFFGFVRERANLAAQNEGRLPEDYAEILARTFEVSVAEVLSTEQRLSGDASLNVPVGEEADQEMIDFLVDASPNPEQVVVANDDLDQRLVALRDALTVLNAREMRVIQTRRLAEDEDKLTLEDLANEFHVSRERIRQIEVRAMDKITDAMQRRERARQAERVALIHDVAHAA